MAKKRKPAGSQPPATTEWLPSTRSEYREALIRLVRRQLGCARRGEIGTRAWELAYRGDLERIDAYVIPASLWIDALPRWYPPQFGSPASWIVIEPEPMPNPTLTLGPTHQFHVIPADDPDAIQAVNMIAVHTLARWLVLAKAVPNDSKSAKRPYEDQWRFYDWFRPAGISGDTLRKWHQHKKIRVEKRNGKNVYNVGDAFYLCGLTPAAAYVCCTNAERDRLPGKRTSSS